MKTNTKRNPLLILALGFAFLAGFAASAEVTSLVNYQGKLKKHGTNENGQVNITFKIFTGATNGECVYEETRSVTVVDGLYSTLIGENPTLGTIEGATMLDDAHIELAIEGKPMSPREKFCPPAFAKKSTQRWNMFSSSGDPLGDLQLSSKMGSSQLIFPGTFFWSQTAAFPLPAETSTITSAKILWTSLSAEAFGYGPVVVAVRCRLKVVNFLNGDARMIGSERFFYSTNTALKVWHSLPLSTNSADLMIQPAEYLCLDVDMAHYSPEPNGVAQSVYTIDIRVK